MQSNRPFTPRAQKVIEFARAKASSERREPSVSDIAFGLLDLGGGVASNFLSKLQVDNATLAEDLERHSDSEPYTVLIPFADEEAECLSHSLIGTEQFFWP